MPSMVGGEEQPLQTVVEVVVQPKDGEEDPHSERQKAVLQTNTSYETF